MLIVATEDGIKVEDIELSSLTEMKAFIEAHAPKELEVGLGAHLPEELNASIAAHEPSEIPASITPIPYHKLEIQVDWIVHHSTVEATIDMHEPLDFESIVAIHSPSDLQALIRPMHTSSFILWATALKSGSLDLLAYLVGVYSEAVDLQALMSIWGIGDLMVPIRGHTPSDLSIHTHVWTPSIFTSVLDSHGPQALQISFGSIPEAGIGLEVIHRIYRLEMLFVDFDIWEYYKDVTIYLQGFFASSFETVFTSGSYSSVNLLIDGTSGYRNLYVTLKPSSRVVSTIIPVFTVEIKDLYISLNQGWPCGFGSAYSLLRVALDTAYINDLWITFKTIHGSGQLAFGSFINKTFFDAYIDSFSITINIPKESHPPESVIVDSETVVYDTEFSELYQEILRVNFRWPRFKWVSGDFGLTVELFSYRGDTVYSLLVYFTADRPKAPIMPQSQPIKIKESDLEENIWPDIFQVKEIELWSLDPPEMVRKVEILFEEQIKEYYWVSSEQKAYSKRVWEQWAFLTRGYLPSAEYSGRIRYETMRSLSSMKRYETIDAAVKAMLANFLFSDLSNLGVVLEASGSYRNLRVNLRIWGQENLRNLLVRLHPAHTTDLSITLNPV